MIIRMVLTGTFIVNMFNTKTSTLYFHEIITTAINSFIVYSFVDIVHRIEHNRTVNSSSACVCF